MANDIGKVSGSLISPRNIESITKGTPMTGLSPGSLSNQAGAVTQTSLSQVFPENLQSALLMLLQPSVASQALFNKANFRRKTGDMKNKTKKMASQDKKFSAASKLFDEIDENNDLFEGYFLSNLQS